MGVCRISGQITPVDLQDRFGFADMKATATKTAQAAGQRLHCRQVQATWPVSDLAQDVREGLLSSPCSLPPKYFYDDRGSRLFDAICDTPEYYPTRIENSLLRRHAAEIVASVRPKHIIEFGSGSSRKTHHLLRACEAQGVLPTYWPFDICDSMLQETGRALIREYSWLTVRGLVGDYLAGLDDVPRPDGACLFVFLGGTIGNFTQRQAAVFLREVRRCMEPNDALLLGADRVKDTEILNAAYNDAEGRTAQFNLNVLNVINRELNADFDLNKFAHIAYYEEDLQQIEMYLVALDEQQVCIGALNREVRLRAGERILTEISRKFKPEDLVLMLRQADLCMEMHRQPDNGYFSLLLARPTDS